MKPSGVLRRRRRRQLAPSASDGVADGSPLHRRRAARPSSAYLAGDAGNRSMPMAPGTSVTVGPTGVPSQRPSRRRATRVTDYGFRIDRSATRRRSTHERNSQHGRPARLRAGPALGARPGAERAGLLRRPRRAEPLLGHRRHLPVRVPDHLGRRRAARRAADDRPQHPARGRRDRLRQRRQQQGHATSSTRTTTPTTSARRRSSTRTSRASGTRRRAGCCCATTIRPGRRTRRPSRTAARSRSAASASTWPGTAPTTRPTTSSSTCPTTTR